MTPLLSFRVKLLFFSGKTVSAWSITLQTGGEENMIQQRLGAPYTHNENHVKTAALNRKMQSFDRDNQNKAG